MHLLSNRGSRFVFALAATLGTSLSASLGGFAQAQTPPTPTLKLSPVMYFFASNPTGNIISDGTGRFFGAVGSGTIASGGLIYRLEADRGSVPTIYQYGRQNVWQGANPNAGLLLASDGFLYGVTKYNSIDTLRGGVTGTGTIFRLSVDGAYTKLFEFDPYTVDSRQYAINASGFEPEAKLIEGMESGVRYLYGSTLRGGPQGTGVIFKVRADGTGGITVLHSFSAAYIKDEVTSGVTTQIFDLNAENELRNYDGANPNQRLLIGPDQMLYGTTRIGGHNGTGTVFRLSRDGATFEFVPFDKSPINVIDTASPDYGKRKTNRSGAYPLGGLTAAANGLIYGTASSHGGLDDPDATGYGGDYGSGIVFSINPLTAFPTQPAAPTPLDKPYAPATFTTSNYIQPLLKFTGAGTTAAPGASPGQQPSGDLIVADDGQLVGTTTGNGSTTEGVSGGNVYKLALDGATPPTQLCIFSKTDTEVVAKGVYPGLGVIQSPVDNAFYGIASGGNTGSGVIFKCGATDHTGPVLGVAPPYDDGSGTISPGLLAALSMLLVMQARRMGRARKN